MSTWNGKYQSIYHIIEKVLRDTNSKGTVDLYDAIEWAGECIEFIAAPIPLSDRHDCITIENFKGKLPCDLYMLMGAREDDSKQTMRYETDIYHHTKVCQDVNHNCSSDITYTINDDYMFTSFEEGTVEIVYKAVPTDSNGFPLIPDDIKFVKAVEYYIMERIFFRKLIAGSIGENVYARIERDRDWYMGAAQTRGVMPSPDMMESIKNNWLRLIPKINHHASGFKGIGEAEQRYTHNSHLGNGSNTNRNDETDTNPTYFYRG